jgi:uncharacterized membrane protein YedE/YeeE
MAEANVVGGIIGGGLIGLASLMLLALNGRIAGVSGIVGGILTGSAGDRWWRAAFVVGLIAGAEVYALAPRGGLPLHMQAQGLGLIAAGLLVGIGTRIGSGCTSGHGVCGLARLSSRSLVATLTFIIVAVITVFLSRHVFS